ncbi:hypothetical protein BBUWI9123_K0034 (plasmid) [Borreliella burgdorferi WI91-23]|nr:hypothetical protein BBUWI9123_K0034 [Borreliella burgdorferi WI91-23]
MKAKSKNIDNIVNFILDELSINSILNIVETFAKKNEF